MTCSSCHKSDEWLPTIGASLRGGKVKVSRLYPGLGGTYCTSACSYGGYHDHSKWKTVLTRNYPETPVQRTEFVEALWVVLRDGGPNHVLDVSHYAGEEWEWLTRGEDLDDVKTRSQWVGATMRALARHQRMRLYGDVHDVEAHMARMAA